MNPNVVPHLTNAKLVPNILLPQKNKINEILQVNLVNALT